MSDEKLKYYSWLIEKLAIEILDFGWIKISKKFQEQLLKPKSIIKMIAEYILKLQNWAESKKIEKEQEILDFVNSLIELKEQLEKYDDLHIEIGKLMQEKRRVWNSILSLKAKTKEHLLNIDEKFGPK